MAPSKVSDGKRRGPRGPQLPEESEEALALAFAGLRKAKLRYVAAWRSWMVWDGVVWRPDQKQAVLNGIRTLTRAAADRIMDGQEARARARAISVASARSAEAVERLARTDGRLAAEPTGWDAQPMLLASPAGVVDLRTGQVTKARPELQLTKLAATSPAAEVLCPRWLDFLDTISGGDREMVGYLQRLAGYCLTGDTREHALFFLHGPGRNGKSVFISTLASILHEHAKTAPMDMLVASQGERHPTDLAMLRGARLVVAHETEANRPWAASKIKQLTGGDRISARLMRMDFFEFQPQFKLVVVGNHLPSLGRLDPALCARIHVVPFPVVIPSNKRDKALSEKLLKESPGILRWALAGCLAWQQEGLNPPDAVLAATRDYVKEADPIEAWLAQSCVRAIHGKESSSDLFASWCRWASAHSQAAGSQKAFSQNLIMRGFAQARLAGGRSCFTGISLSRKRTGEGSEGSPANDRVHT